MVFLKLALSFVAALIILVLLWLARGLILTPVKKGINQHLTVVVSVDGPSAELEHTVEGLCWLIANGTLEADVEIANLGADEETLNIAEKLAQKHGCVTLRLSGGTFDGVSSEYGTDSGNYRRSSVHK